MNPVLFIQGAVAMGCLVASVFFLKFWQQSRDRLFISFAAAFALIAISYGLLGTMSFASDWRVSVFIVRLLAFCLILQAIFDKNRR
jgi:uncharacterized protein DUF5985